jgi:hypothetical protein
VGVDPALPPFDLQSNGQPTFISFSYLILIDSPRNLDPFLFFSRLWTMSANGLLRKDQLERSLHDEKKLIEEGILKEDNPLDFSENFQKLCAACRRGDLKVCQEMIVEGTNINAKDQYDYTPLILVSLGLGVDIATRPSVALTSNY